MPEGRPGPSGELSEDGAVLPCVRQRKSRGVSVDLVGAWHGLEAWAFPAGPVPEGRVPTQVPGGFLEEVSRIPAPVTVGRERRAKVPGSVCGEGRSHRW